MKQSIDYCIERKAFRDFYTASGGNNRASVKTVKSLLPLIIENELSPMQKKCITLHYFKNLTQQEIADRIGVTQPTVSRSLKAARKKVGTILNYSLLAANRVSAMLQ